LIQASETQRRIIAVIVLLLNIPQKNSNLQELKDIKVNPACGVEEQLVAIAGRGRLVDSFGYLASALRPNFFKPIKLVTERLHHGCITFCVNFSLAFYFAARLNVSTTKMGEIHLATRLKERMREELESMLDGVIKGMLFTCKLCHFIHIFLHEIHSPQ